MLENQKKALNLQRVFHSIRFKVNKIGLKRQPFFMSIREDTLRLNEECRMKNNNYNTKIHSTFFISSLSTLRASCRFAMSRSS